jgi:methylated-DNA-protein-cysteine methyltransferase-like protein
MKSSYPRVSFFERVYRIVRRIPRGQVTSYGAIAHMLGNPRGARTVGWALHGLPEGSDVPWQRVISSQGRISTSCREHGARVQRELLQAEGVGFDERGYVDLERFGWDGLTWIEVDDLVGTS